MSNREISIIPHHNLISGTWKATDRFTRFPEHNNGFLDFRKQQKATDKLQRQTVIHNHVQNNSFENYTHCKHAVIQHHEKIYEKPLHWENWFFSWFLSTSSYIFSKYTGTCLTCWLPFFAHLLIIIATTSCKQAHKEGNNKQHIETCISVNLPLIYCSPHSFTCYHTNTFSLNKLPPARLSHLFIHGSFPLHVFASLFQATRQLLSHPGIFKKSAVACRLKSNKISASNTPLKEPVLFENHNHPNGDETTTNTYTNSQQRPLVRQKQMSWKWWEW